MKAFICFGMKKISLRSYQLTVYDFPSTRFSFRKQTSTERANNKCATCIIVRKKFVYDEYQVSLSHVFVKHKWVLNVVNDLYVVFDNSIECIMMSVNKLNIQFHHKFPIETCSHVKYNQLNHKGTFNFHSYDLAKDNHFMMLLMLCT